MLQSGISPRMSPERKHTGRDCLVDMRQKNVIIFFTVILQQASIHYISYIYHCGSMIYSHILSQIHDIFSPFLIFFDYICNENIFVKKSVSPLLLENKDFHQLSI